MFKGKQLFQLFVLTTIYVLLANARTHEPNPFIDGATLAVQMIVPVFSGILFGPKIGAAVGLLGSGLNYFSPAGSMIDLYAIAPHAAMGYLAGLLRQRLPAPGAAFALIPGHLMVIGVTMAFGAFDFGLLSKTYFFQALAYESFVGIIAVIVLVEVYRLAFE